MTTSEEERAARREAEWIRNNELLCSYCGKRETDAGDWVHVYLNRYRLAEKVLESKASFSVVEPGLWEMQFMPGTHIDTASKAAQSLQTLTRERVRFRFNGLMLSVEPIDESDAKAVAHV